MLDPVLRQDVLDGQCSIDRHEFVLTPKECCVQPLEDVNYLGLIERLIYVLRAPRFAKSSISWPFCGFAGLFGQLLHEVGVSQAVASEVPR